MWECSETLLDIPATLAMINMLALHHHHHHKQKQQQQQQQQQQKVQKFEYNQATVR